MESPRELTYPGGDKRIFVRTAEETGGEVLEMDVTYLAISDRPPAHFHPFQEESFEVLAGKFRVWVEGEENVYAAGDQFVIPKAAEHWMHNITELEGRLKWEVRPALRTQEFFTSLWRGTMESGKNAPNLFHLALILQEYRDEFRVSNPSEGIQKYLFGFLAMIGKLLRYSP